MKKINYFQCGIILLSGFFVILLLIGNVSMLLGARGGTADARKGLSQEVDRSTGAYHFSSKEMADKKQQEADGTLPKGTDPKLTAEKEVQKAKGYITGEKRKVKDVTDIKVTPFIESRLPKKKDEEQKKTVDLFKLSEEESVDSRKKLFESTPQQPEPMPPFQQPQKLEQFTPTQFGQEFTTPSQETSLTEQQKLQEKNIRDLDPSILTMEQAQDQDPTTLSPADQQQRTLDPTISLAPPPPLPDRGPQLQQPQFGATESQPSLRAQQFGPEPDTPTMQQQPTPGLSEPSEAGRVQVEREKDPSGIPSGVEKTIQETTLEATFTGQGKLEATTTTENLASKFFHIERSSGEKGAAKQIITDTPLASPSQGTLKDSEGDPLATGFLDTGAERRTPEKFPQDTGEAIPGQVTPDAQDPSQQALKQGQGAAGIKAEGDPQQIVTERQAGLVAGQDPKRPEVEGPIGPPTPTPRDPKKNDVPKGDPTEKDPIEGGTPPDAGGPPPKDDGIDKTKVGLGMLGVGGLIGLAIGLPLAFVDTGGDGGGSDATGGAIAGDEEKEPDITGVEETAPQFGFGGPGGVAGPGPGAAGPGAGTTGEAADDLPPGGGLVAGPVPEEQKRDREPSADEIKFLMELDREAKVKSENVAAEINE